jgi:SCF-associated factor 1
MMDGMIHNQHPFREPKFLEYPPGYVPPSKRYNSHTAIRQFSTGRNHILGVSDSGRIWSWHDADRPAVHIKFLTIDINESEHQVQSPKRGHVRSVFAGWSRSMAYIEGTGIVAWTPSDQSELMGQSDQSEIDTMLVMEQWVVPHSGYLNLTMDTVDKQNNADVRITSHVSRLLLTDTDYL